MNTAERLQLVERFSPSHALGEFSEPSLKLVRVPEQAAEATSFHKGNGSPPGWGSVAARQHRDRSPASGHPRPQLEQCGNRDQRDRGGRHDQVGGAQRGVSLEQVVEIGGVCGHAIDDRLPHPERVVLDQPVHGPGYMEAMIALPAWGDWRADALNETWVVPEDEADWPTVLTA